MNLPNLFAEESTNTAMMIIEVVKQPTLWDYVKEYFYIPALIIIIVFIIWRKVKSE